MTKFGKKKSGQTVKKKKSGQLVKTKRVGQIMVYVGQENGLS